MRGMRGVGDEEIWRELYTACEAMLGIGKVLVYLLGSSGGVMRLYVSDELLSVIDQEQEAAD